MKIIITEICILYLQNQYYFSQALWYRYVITALRSYLQDLGFSGSLSYKMKLSKKNLKIKRILLSLLIMVNEQERLFGDHF